MAEAYADKMARKTDAELHQYVTGRAQYREDAVLAALDELARRGQAHPDDALVRPEVTAVVAAQAAQAAEVRQVAERAEVVPAAPAEPTLYSPVTIAIFSILPMSTMIGGGILLAMNLFRLGRIRAMLALVLFIVVYFLVGTNLLNLAIFQYGLNPLLGAMVFNIPAMLAYLLWFWPRYVATSNYRSRSVLLPVVVCFLLVWGIQKITPYIIEHQPAAVRQQMEKLIKR